LGAEQIVAVLAACERLRDRFLLSLLAETGVFSGGRSRGLGIFAGEPAVMRG
jgi:hypothetical protein